MIAIQTSDRNGKLVAASLVSTEDQIMLITTGGILVRTRVSEIREMGRSTQGVKLINVDEGTVLSGLQRISESMDEDDSIADDVSIVGESEISDENNPPSDTTDETPAE